MDWYLRCDLLMDWNLRHDLLIDMDLRHDVQIDWDLEYVIYWWTLRIRWQLTDGLEFGACDLLIGMDFRSELPIVMDLRCDLVIDWDLEHVIYWWTWIWGACDLLVYMDLRSVLLIDRDLRCVLLTDMDLRRDTDWYGFEARLTDRLRLGACVLVVRLIIWWDSLYINDGAATSTRLNLICKNHP